MALSLLNSLILPVGSRQLRVDISPDMFRVGCDLGMNYRAEILEACTIFLANIIFSIFHSERFRDIFNRSAKWDTFLMANNTRHGTKFLLSEWYTIVNPEDCPIAAYCRIPCHLN